MCLRPSLLALVVTLAAGGAEGTRAAQPTRIGANGKDGLRYVFLPAGRFAMGCVPGDGCDKEDRKDETPRHVVELTKGFWMGQTEVTVEAFGKFVSATQRRTTAEMDGWSPFFDGRQVVKREGMSWRSPGFEQGPKHPAVVVSWYDAEAYCAWSRGRLPTEAEWEYAARGGESSSTYVWGNAPTPLVGAAKQANVADESARRVYATWTTTPGYDDGYAETAPVGTFAANGFDLHDMEGNAAEWCADWYDEAAYRAGDAQTDPKGPAVGEQRVLRGGSWVDDGPFLRTSRRYWDTPLTHNSFIGFRCARDGAP